jgi:hypothetical protein
MPPVGSLGPPLCIITFSTINKRQVPHFLEFTNLFYAQYAESTTTP